MAKEKKTTRSKKPSVKVGDMTAKKNPKGGLNFGVQQMTQKEFTTVAPSPELNFNKIRG